MPIMMPEQEDEEMSMLEKMRREFFRLKDADPPSQRRMTPLPDQSPEDLGNQMMQQNPLMRFFNGSGEQRARSSANIESEMQREADGLMADEAAANKRKFHPPMSDGWHPPMDPKMSPNVPRDPAKEQREKEAMKAFLSGGGGPSYGMKKPSPMSSIVPSQNPFSKPTASPEQQSQVAGRMMMSQLPQSQPSLPEAGMPRPRNPMPEGYPDYSMGQQNPMGPELPTDSNPGQSSELMDQLPVNQPAVPDVQGGIPKPMFPMPEGYPDYSFDDAENPMGPELPPSQEDPAGPVDPLRDRLMKMMDAERSPDGMDESRDRRHELDDRMNAVSSQNADLGFMKLLMRNANQMGQIGGKVASSAPFDDAIDGMQQRNSQAEQRYTVADQKSKSDKDDRMKHMLAMMKMDQDGALRREGFDVQREGYKNASADRNALLGATLGRDANSFELGNKKLTLEEQMAQAKAEREGQKLTLEQRTAQDRADRENRAAELSDLRENNRFLREGNRDKLTEKNIDSQIKDRAEARRLDGERISAQTAKAAADSARRGDHLPEGYKQRVSVLSTKQANRSSMINKMKSSLAELQRIKDPKAKWDYAKTQLKMLNSPENPDAVGKEEAERVGANLDNFRFSDVFVGSNPFGKNFKAYEDMIQSQINAMEGNYKADQAEIDSIARQYPAPRGVANPGLTNPSPAPSSGRRTISNFDDL